MKHRDIIQKGGQFHEANPDFGYLPGFGNSHASEAVAGALPIGRNSPQRHPMGLYAEQLSGTAFTAPRAENKRSWLYRILPSVKYGINFKQTDHNLWRTAPCSETAPTHAQLRWGAVDMPTEEVDFIGGIKTITACGDARMQAGMASHVYTATTSMERRYLQNNDGEMLILPEMNAVNCFSEFGILHVAPGEMLVIPRGVKFRIDLVDGAIRGYICENYGQSLTLPERGPIGANCLANARDFLYPVAAFEDMEAPCELFMKTGGALFSTKLSASPLDVVAWHGNYAPYKYDLKRYAAVGSISFDHPDPSIFTVLTSPSDTAGTANVDFVIFPERWLVMEDSFRPPWYHMNIMSEFMGLIYGVYDAKPGGFVPGGMSLHNAMLAHGPDVEAFEAASSKELVPEKLAGTMAFMFETRYAQQPTEYALQLPTQDSNYIDCWAGLKRNFKVEDWI